MKLQRILLFTDKSLLGAYNPEMLVFTGLLSLQLGVELGGLMYTSTFVGNLSSYPLCFPTCCNPSLLLLFSVLPNRPYTGFC